MGYGKQSVPHTMIVELDEYYYEDVTLSVWAYNKVVKPSLKSKTAIKSRLKSKNKYKQRR